MIRRISVLLLLALSCEALLIACGGARPIEGHSADDAQGRERGSRDRRRADREDDESDEFPLDPPAAVAGTGVRVRAPRGSERSAIGSTFIHARRRIQIVIAAAEGDLSVHQQFRSGLTADAEEVESEELEIDGAPASLTVDRMTQGEAELERVWVLVRRGTRSVAAMGVYSVERSETLRGLVRASVLSVRFDEEAAIDPEAAVGWRVAGVEGLQLVRTASTNISYSLDGTPPEGGTRDPLLFLMPIPIEVPEGERAALCPEILAQLVQLPSGDAVDHGTISAGEVVGCDIAGSTGDPPELATYAALVFRGPAAFMIGGTVEATRRDPWIARFRGAAGTIESVGAPPARSRAAVDDEEEEAEDEEDEEDEEQD